MQILIHFRFNQLKIINSNYISDDDFQHEFVNSSKDEKSANLQKKNLLPVM